MSDRDIESGLKDVTWIQRYAPVLNFAGLVAWALATILFIVITSSKEWIWYNQLRYMGIVVYSVGYGILTMIAGVILVNIFTPWFSFVELFKGDGQSKIAGAIIFASIIVSTAIIFLAAN